MTSQLALDLGPPPPPSFENFVPGANGEACDALRRIAGGDRRDRFVYLWGTPGSGRSHLLQAARRAAGGHGQVSRALCPLAALDAFGFDPAVRLWTLDDCDGLDATRQQAGFHLFNAIQANPRAALLAGGSAPPAALPLSPELRTRLGWGLVLQLQPLNDAERAEALWRTVNERGLAASPDVIDYLLTHARRDMGSLRATIDALDRFALQRKRALTLPLLREFLQLQLAGDPGER